MAKGLPRRYFDSDIIIRYVHNDPDAGPVVEALLQEEDAGRWTLVVSAVSMLEVTRPRNQPVDPAKYATILSFFDNSYIFVRELDILLAEKAQKLIYDYLRLHQKDAAHLASAIDTDCDIFYTYENEIIEKFDGEHGLRVQRPEMPTKPETTEHPGTVPLPLFDRSES